MYFYKTSGICTPKCGGLSIGTVSPTKESAGFAQNKIDPCQKLVSLYQNVLGSPFSIYLPLSLVCFVFFLYRSTRDFCAKDEKKSSVLHRSNRRLNNDTLSCVLVFVFVSLLFNAKRECGSGQAQRWSTNRSLTSSQKKKKTEEEVVACFQSWFPGARLSLIL